MAFRDTRNELKTSLVQLSASAFQGGKRNQKFIHLILIRFVWYADEGGRGSTMKTAHVPSPEPGAILQRLIRLGEILEMPLHHFDKLLLCFTRDLRSMCPLTGVLAV